jgi:septum formation protein
MMKQFILASASEQRRLLLKERAFAFKIFPADLDESSFQTCEASATALKRARAKALKVAEIFPRHWVLGADTVVEGPEPHREQLGKASGEQEARRMLKTLSGSRHQVFSAAAFVRKDEIFSHVACATLDLKKISETELENYLQTGESFGKAGALCVQGKGRNFVQTIIGEEAVVLGLPLEWVEKFLDQHLQKIGLE